jgi:sigma-B regulation protein RsbU (phosphoserine phosphatase)
MDLKGKGYLLLKNLMDNMTDHIYFKDLESRFIMMNKSSARWQGYDSPDEAIGESDFDKYAREDALRMFEAEQQIIETGTPIEGIEERETWKDGQEAWVSTTKMPLRDENDQIIGTFGISRDISRHKEAELRAARYFQEIQQIKEGMEEDIRMAAELQKTFFPRRYPVFPEGCSPEDSRVGFHHHYYASGVVSGDFCAIHRLSDTECGVLQCDVMGHGVRAALVTALICAMVEELAQQERDPGGFLGRMNNLLLPILQQEDTLLYATACYIVYDTATGIVRVSNAGHPNPLLIRSSENSADWLMDDVSLRGPALAICEDAVFHAVEKQIKPGDAVVMYTDGLYEVVDAGGREFGEKRLIDSACRHARYGLKELFPALINDARHFSEEGVFDDDICLVGFKCQSLGAK